MTFCVRLAVDARTVYGEILNLKTKRDVYRERQQFVNLHMENIAVMSYLLFRGEILHENSNGVSSSMWRNRNSSVHRLFFFAVQPHKVPINFTD